MGAARPQGLSLHGAARAKRLLVRPVRRRPWIRRVSAVVSLGEGSRGRLDGSPITVFGLSGRSSGEISFVVLFFLPDCAIDARTLHVPCAFFFSSSAGGRWTSAVWTSCLSFSSLSLPSSWNTGLDLDFDSNLLCVCVWKIWCWEGPTEFLGIVGDCPFSPTSSFRFSSTFPRDTLEVLLLLFSSAWVPR